MNAAEFAKSEKGRGILTGAKSILLKDKTLDPLADWQIPVACFFAEAFAASETAAKEAAELAVCKKQFHMYVWTKEPFFYAVAQAGSVTEARELMLEEIGSGDGSCPEREKAAAWIREQSPYIFHRENATFGLTDSAEIAEMSSYTEKLQANLKAAEAERDRAVRALTELFSANVREKGTPLRWPEGSAMGEAAKILSPVPVPAPTKENP